jgi:hypothetical protein
MYYKVKGNSNLVRDKNTNAILNVNHLEYENYNKSNLSKEKENARFEKIESEISTMKDDLNLIKTLLLEIKNESR